MVSRGWLSCALILTAGAAVQAQTVMPGSPFINPANGHTYYLLTQSNWDTAESAAVNLGGHLATINNAAENAWVYGTYGMFGGTPRAMWLGLNDAVSEGNYVWTSGENPGYMNWAFTEPNNLNNEDYVHIFEPGEPLNRGSFWNDNIITGAGGGAASLIPNGLVEVVPEPATMIMLLIIALLISRHWFRKKELNASPPPQRKNRVF